MQTKGRCRIGRAPELHRGGAGLLLVTLSEVALRNVVFRRASSHDVCDLYIRMAPEPHARSLPLRTTSERDQALGWRPPRDARLSSNWEEIRGFGRAPAQSMRATAPDRLLTGTSETIGKGLLAVPSAPASYPRSCQSKTPRWSPQRLDGRRPRSVPRLATSRCPERRRPRPALMSTRAG
jgi:hypothetical protein